MNWHPKGYCLIHIKQTDGSRKIFRIHNYIHTELCGKTTPIGKVLHHINDFKWHNRMCNLEPTTSAHNSAAVDKKTENTTSEYKGVSFAKDKNKWRSAITYNKKVIPLGYFIDEYEAALVYDRAFTAIHKSNKLLGE
jgi:hypothetical protein